MTNVSTTSKSQSPAKVAFASFIGTTVEWYDYFLFGTAAVLVLNDQFFPTLSPLAGTLAALATFGVAFVFRPLGAVIFGHFGDRVSRKKMLVWSLLAMGVSTFAVGLLPNYETAGIAAPISLVVLRLIQGLAVGGEWGGAVLMSLEHAPPQKKAFFASWPQAGVPAGVLLSSGAFFLVQLLPDEQVASFGWRLPFLGSAILIAIGLFIRLRLTESPEFLEMKAKKSDHRIPFTAVLKTSKKSLLIGIFSLTGSNTLFYISTVYLLDYAPTNVGLAEGALLLAISFGALLDIFAIPAVAIFADRHGSRKMLLIGSVLTAVAAIPIFLLINIGNPLGAFLALVLALPIAHSIVYATISGFIATLFDPSVRYTGASLAYQISGIVSSAPAPLLAALIFAGTGTFLGVAGYLIVANIIALIAISLAPKDQVVERSTDRPDAAEPPIGQR